MKNKFKILCVDSSRLFQAVVKEISNTNGFFTKFVSSGKEALTEIKNQDYDIVCSAYHLSDIAGDKLCNQIRVVPGYQHIRIILFTAEEDKNLLKKALLAGATDIFCKTQFKQFEAYLKRSSQSICNTNIGQILLIEDSPSQLKWMEVVLSEAGWEVHSFSNAVEAMTSFSENEYDLVVTDIVLEGAMSGLSLVREIRRISTDKGLTPIFAMSAYNEASRRIELYHLGVNDYIAKPIIPEEFIFRVNTLIKSHRTFNELNEEKNHLKSLALLDSVTGLYNRNAFNQFATMELEKSKRNQTPMSLAIVDIDYFKLVNDKLGHDVGDQVLADVGLWLSKTLRKGDMVFRWGGEEFVILLNACSPENAKDVLEKQRIRFNKRKFANVAITASTGISNVKIINEKTTIKQLFKQADEAVYKAKELGRNRVLTFSHKQPTNTKP